MTKESYKVTVLMSVYNSESYLQPAIQSILAQTFSDFEFLIIDDGSTDSSPKIISSFSDDRIRVLTNSRNLGLTKSLNVGLSEARGEYIARLDADDIAMPDRLSEQVELLDNNPGVGLATSWRYLINEQGQVVNTDNVVYEPEDYFYILHFRNCIVHSSVMFRKSLIQQLGGYDDSYLKAQDFELWNRLSKHVKIMQVPEVLVHQRLGNNTISSKFGEEQLKTVKQVAGRNINLLLGREVKPEVLAELVSYGTKNKKDLVEVIAELKEINRKIPVVEADIIQRLELNSKRLYAIMQSAVTELGKQTQSSVSLLRKLRSVFGL